MCGLLPWRGGKKHKILIFTAASLWLDLFEPWRRGTVTRVSNHSKSLRKREHDESLVVGDVGLSRRKLSTRWQGWRRETRKLYMSRGVAAKT